MRNVLFFVVFTVLLLSACSLKYEDDENLTESAPEFTFTGLEMNRIENGKKTASLNAAKLEQYYNEDGMYAKNVIFTLFDDNGKIEVDGSCGLLSVDNSLDLYCLFQNVLINSYAQSISVMGENIKWNGKTEQLVCGEDDEMVISTGIEQKSDDYVQPKNPSTNKMEIKGSSFAASGVSMAYEFSNHVTGTLITDNTESENQSIDLLSDEELAKEAEIDESLLKPVKNENK